MSTESTIACHFVRTGNKWFAVRFMLALLMQQNVQDKLLWRWAWKSWIYDQSMTYSATRTKCNRSSFYSKCKKKYHTNHPTFIASRFNSVNIAIVNKLQWAQSRHREWVGRWTARVSKRRIENACLSARPNAPNSEYIEIGVHYYFGISLLLLYRRVDLFLWKCCMVFCWSKIISIRHQFFPVRTCSV